MTDRMVHWHEGMFLRPQHFQTAQRYWSRLVTDNSRWDNHYNWGLRVLELDKDALANFRCVVRALEARLRDGTMVIISDDDPLPPLPLEEAFAQKSTLELFLGVPLFHLGRPNATSPGGGEEARFVQDSMELEDENTGTNPQVVPIRRLNPKLLLSTDVLTGYEIIPLGHLEKSGRAESTPQLDETYIPPLLACNAWAPLNAGLLQGLYERIGKKMELLADQVVTRGITFDNNAQGDALIFNQLRELNEAYTTLGVLVFAHGVHPLLAYGELCRIVGQLAIFGHECKPPDLPLYDHDDLAGCFFKVRRYIDDFLDVFREPEYQERALIGAGMRMQVTLEPAWMEVNRQLLLAVRTPLNKDECVALLTKTGGLDMKIGSSNRVDTIYREGSAGLRFSHVPTPPRALPTPQGVVYLQILSSPRDPEWQQIRSSLTLAIRINENLVAGNIEGQRVLTIRHGGQTVTLQFTLYILAQGATN